MFDRRSDMCWRRTVERTQEIHGGGDANSGHEGLQGERQTRTESPRDGSTDCKGGTFFRFAITLLRAFYYKKMLWKFMWEESNIKKKRNTSILQNYYFGNNSDTIYHWLFGLPPVPWLYQFFMTYLLIS